MKKKKEITEPVGNLFGGQVQGSLIDLANNTPPTIRHKKYRVLSPDGFDIRYDTTWTTREAAEKACKEWAESFRPQGYYSTIRDGERFRIPIEDIPGYCNIA